MKDPHYFFYAVGVLMLADMRSYDRIEDRITLKIQTKSLRVAREKFS